MPQGDAKKIDEALRAALDGAEGKQVCAFVKLKGSVGEQAPPQFTRGADEDRRRFRQRIVQAHRERANRRYQSAVEMLTQFKLTVRVPVYGDYVLIRGTADSIRNALASDLVEEAHADPELELHFGSPSQPLAKMSPLFWQFLTIIRYYPWSPLGRLGKKLWLNQLKPKTLDALVGRLSDVVKLVPPEKRDTTFRTITEYLETRPVRRDLEPLLGEMLRKTGAASCGLFVRDPWNPPELRPYILLGYRYPEALFGYCGPGGRASLWGEDEVDPSGRDAAFHDDAVAAVASTESFDYKSPIPHEFPTVGQLRHKLSEKLPIFGNLPAREGISSCARLRVSRGGQPAFVLWVNFARPVKFEDQRGLREALAACRDEIDRLTADGEVDAELPPVFSSPALLGLNRVCERLESEAAALDADAERRAEVQVEEFLTRHLGALLQTIQMPHPDDPGSTPLSECGSANISLLKSGEGALEIVAAAGRYKPDLSGKRYAQSLRVSQARGDAGGQPLVGIASWVAVRGRPLLVNDVKRSGFRSIYYQLDGDIEHEIALPLVVEDRVIGVLNFESATIPFPKEWVTPLYDVATKFARAWSAFERRRCERQLAIQNRNVFRRLCDVVFDDILNSMIAPAVKLSPEFRVATIRDLTAKLFGRWAQLACDTLHASRCVVWCEDPAKHGRLVRMGKYPPPGDEKLTPEQRDDDQTHENSPPRPGGWTHYVLRTGEPLCLARRGEGYEPLFWREKEGRANWTRTPRADVATPAEPNVRVTAQKAACEVAIPLVRDGKCFGVAWVKYTDYPPDDPVQQFQHQVSLKQSATQFYRFSQEDSVHDLKLVAPAEERMQLIAPPEKGAGEGQEPMSLATLTVEVVPTAERMYQAVATICNGLSEDDLQQLWAVQPFLTSEPF